MPPDEVLKHIITRIAPHILDILARKDNACIELHFAHGEFKTPRKLVSI
jgi:hypothetical protein